jgi:hypothetical protein
MLPIALSEVLGISLSEVMEHYFDGSERVSEFVGLRMTWRGRDIRSGG